MTAIIGECPCSPPWLPSRNFLDADAAVLHLTAVAFEADGAGGGEFHRSFQNLSIAQAIGHAFVHGHFDLVPVASPVMLEVLVRAGERVIAALKLSATNEDPAIGVGRRAEFQAQDEVLREFLRGGNLLYPSAFGRSGDDQPAVFGDESPVGAARAAVETDGVCDDRPGG